MNFQEALRIRPEFDIPERLTGDNITIDDNVNGTISFKVVGKDENGIRIRIESVRLKPKKRKI